MPFTNPIIAGTTLVRPSIKSPDYVAGVSGWSINRDGTAQFNNVEVRGAMQIGNSAEAGSTYIGPIAGDPYLAQFVGTLDAAAITYADQKIAVADVTQYDPTGHTFGSFTRYVIAPVAGVATRIADAWNIFVDAVGTTVSATFGTGMAQLILAADEVFHKDRPLVTATSGTGTQHWSSATVTTNASGIATVTHGAGFTPSVVWVGQNGVAGSAGITLFTIAASYTGTTFQVKATTSAGVFVGSVGVTYGCIA